MSKNTKQIDEARIAKVVGARFRLAREMNGLSQTDVYKKFGYSNTSMLAKIEGGNNGKSAPLIVFVNASRIYGVSIDWLYGESEDWERDAQMSQEHETSRWLESQMETMHKIELNIMRTISRQMVALKQATLVALESSQNVQNAFEGFVKIHPEVVDSMRSSRLVNEINNSVAASKKAKCELDKQVMTMKLKNQTEPPKNLDWTKVDL